MQLFMVIGCKVVRILTQSPSSSSNSCLDVTATSLNLGHQNTYGSLAHLCGGYFNSAQTRLISILLQLAF